MRFAATFKRVHLIAGFTVMALDGLHRVGVSGGTKRCR